MTAGSGCPPRATTAGTRCQQGFVLIELAVVLLIATLAAVFAADRLAQGARDAVAEAHAAWMSSLRSAAQRYVELHGLVLAEEGGAARVQGFANAFEPTVAELKETGFLSPGFPARGARGLGGRVLLIRSSGCPAGLCSIEALVYSDGALARDASGGHDSSMVAHWLSVSMGRGGAVMPDRPHVVSGAAFSFPNPPVAGMQALPVGTVAMSVTTEQLASLAYLRVEDRRDPRFQGSASIAGDLSTGAALQVHEHIRIASQARAQTPCDTGGAIVREQNGGLLVCREGLWRSAGGSGGGGYSINSLAGCVAAGANPITGNCSCPAEHMAVRIADSTSAVPSEGRTRGYICVG
ncbi:type II secretion system protein [Pusillimonas noertemannii]|uniref:type II secretion system protein n=1 Tax=Pusillimonas noertemannii TaxID=305977 RepID=UPI00333E21A4